MIHKPHKAFSLTELIIVLVIIALLFAAMAPIITKRHISDTAGVENIWNFVNNDTERNAYFDPGYEGWTSSLYVGMNPLPQRPANQHPGKLIVNSGTITYNDEQYPQPQFQFRFNPSSVQLSNGIDAGALGVDSAGNINFGEIHSFSGNNSTGSNNTIIGFSAVHDAEDADGIVAVGTGVLESAPLENMNGEDGWSHVTAVGTNAGQFASVSNGHSGIYIGAGAGIGHSLSDIGIGYHAFYSNGSNSHDNVAVGVNVGISPHRFDLEYAYNVLINNTVNTRGGMTYNTIIGVDSYNQGTISVADESSDYLSYITAIGSSACASVKPNKGYNTCIGYRSGAENNNSPAYSNIDEHIYLGGVPDGFGGRGVMEVHTYSPEAGAMSANGVDVIFNSNLVIRGKLYTNEASGGVDIANYKFIDTYDSDLINDPNIGRPFEPMYYRCASDEYKNSFLLVYNAYVCMDDYSDESSRAYPRTINLLYRDGNAPDSSSGTVFHSDLRLKNNIVENNVGLNKLLLLEPYNYTFKQDALATAQVGVIAQDLQKVFPASVSKDAKGFLQIRWDEMFYAMINSIKELSRKVDETVQKIADLSRNIASVKSQQKDIRKKISSLDQRVKKLERK